MSENSAGYKSQEKTNKKNELLNYQSRNWMETWVEWQRVMRKETKIAHQSSAPLPERPPVRSRVKLEAADWFSHPGTWACIRRLSGALVGSWLEAEQQELSASNVAKPPLSSLQNTAGPVFLS